MGYDMNLPSTSVLSHSRAFHLNPNFTLLGGVDSDQSKRGLFSHVYSAPVFSDVKEALSYLTPEVVVVAAPTDEHAKILRDILHLGRPGLVLCEKPLSYSLAEATQMVNDCQKTNTKLFVNYIRRSDSAVLKVKTMLDQEEIKGPFEGVALYSKGIIHNGTHMIDLLTFWFGVPVVEEISHGPARPKPRDGTPDAALRFASGSVRIESAGLESNEFSLILRCANGTLRYRDSGHFVTWSPTSNSEENFQENPAQASDRKLKSSMSVYQLRVAEEIMLAIEGFEPNLCSGEQSLESLKIATEIMEEAWNR